jgi:hypothetical protein
MKLEKKSITQKWWWKKIKEGYKFSTGGLNWIENSFNKKKNKLKEWGSNWEK